MALQFSRVKYEDLNAKQKENYNFLKVSSVLADYGYVTIRLSDDWQNADFIAQHRGGEFLKIQLKSRPCFYEKYRGKDLYIAFREGDEWYIYPHDKLLKKVKPKIRDTSSWEKDGGYSFPSISREMRGWLEPCRTMTEPCRVVAEAVQMD